MSHPELIVTRRRVALGKIIVFQSECERLAELVVAGAMAVSDAADALAEAADANDLPETFGADYIQETISIAFESAEPPEVAKPELRLIHGGAA